MAVVRNKMTIKALKKKRTMFSFKEVCFVAGGVIFIFIFFFSTLRYSHSFYILPHSVQETEQKRSHIE